MKPKIIVCLGRIAARELIGKEFKISVSHGGIFDRNDIKYMALYHPSALLRDESKRPETFLDLKKLHRLILDVCPWVLQ